MTRDQRVKLPLLEGRTVSVALADGSRIDDCELVSAERHEPGSLWLFVDGTDTFVPTEVVVDVWEAPPIRQGRCLTTPIRYGALPA